jgi:hypothetical protein
VQGLGLAASVYSTGRSLLVPSPLVGVAGSLESTVSSISRPVFHAVQDQSGKVKCLQAQGVQSTVHQVNRLVVPPACRLLDMHVMPCTEYIAWYRVPVRHSSNAGALVLWCCA